MFTIKVVMLGGNMSLTVYLLYAADRRVFDSFERLMQGNYFEPLHKTVILSPAMANFGPKDRTTGAPGDMMIVVAHDVDGRPAAASTYGLDNENIATLMGKLRRISGEFACYATRNAEMAWHLVRQVAPEREMDIRKAAAARDREYATPPEILVEKLESNLRRAKVEIVKRDGRLFVKKTFRRNALDYMHREIRARDVLKHPAVSPIVERGENYIIIPYYEEGSPWKDNGIRLYPLDKAREFLSFVAWMNMQGYVMLDWHPGSIIFDRHEGMKVIDLEYFSDAPFLPANFESSFDFIDSRSADSEFLRTYKNSSYAAWYALLGIRYDELYGGSRGKVLAKRAFHLIFRRFLRAAGKRSWSILRALRPVAMRRYKPVGDYIKYEKC